MIPDARVMEPQVAVTTPRLVRWLAEEIAFLVKAARPGFWLTSIWFYLVPVGGRHVLDQAEFWLGLVYVSFPLGLLIYGWNGVVDFDVDRFNPRKGTRSEERRVRKECRCRRERRRKKERRRVTTLD